jgi:DNA-binding MarR family transcriptional regulator
MSLSSDIAAVLLEDDDANPVMVLRAIRKTAKDLEHYIVKPLAQEVGLSTMEFSMLRLMLHHLMAGHDSVPHSTIVRRALSSQAMVSRYMTGLQDRGFVETVGREGDARCVFYKLTDRGLDTVVMAEDRLEKVSERIFSGVSDENQKQYRSVLDRISSVLNDPFGLRGS